MKDKYGAGYWYGCLDCDRQWTYYGSIFSTWSRPLDEESRTEVLARIHRIELPPLWSYCDGAAIVEQVRAIDQLVVREHNS